MSSLHIVCVHAFNRSGRLSVMVMIPSLTSVALCSGTAQLLCLLLGRGILACGQHRRDPVEQVGQYASRGTPDEMVADHVGVGADRQPAPHQPAAAIAGEEIC